MKSSPTLRVLMAAGLYLLLMWGYMTLQTPQLYAVFAALIMSIALLFWVSESREREAIVSVDDSSEPIAEKQIVLDDLNEPSVLASNMRLDSLKADLMEQYAQFGRDQSSLTIKGLGPWHPKRDQRRKGS